MHAPLEQIMKSSQHICIIALAAILLHGCTHQERVSTPPDVTHPQRILKMWVHSDIQPRRRSEWIHYERAIRDIRRNVEGISLAIVAGDIVQKKRSGDIYEWFLKIRKRAAINHWYEIAGNHEAKNFPQYYRYIGKPLFYSVRIGNIVILFLSDEINSPPTDISEKAFNWWREQVITHQDKNIITVTHGLLEQSDLLGSSLDKLIIRDSERFAAVLKKYRVDIWISGHTHFPHYLPGKTMESRNEETLFIDVSAIRKDIFTNIESCVFFFTVGSREVHIRSRNHEKQRFETTLDIHHQLRYPFLWNGESPQMYTQTEPHRQ
jgi:predicted phosphodiesterase